MDTRQRIFKNKLNIFSSSNFYLQYQHWWILEHINFITALICPSRVGEVESCLPGAV